MPHLVVRLFYSNRFVFGFVKSNPEYSEVYSFSCAPREDLVDFVFDKFNTDHPSDFDERSMCVGDVVAIEHQDGRHIGAWRCSARDWENVSSSFKW